MIFLQMSLYCEARPILQHEAFHAMPPVGRFQRWQTEDMMLTVSGTGQAEAATCAAVTCAMHHPSASDLFVVLGTCAALEGKAEKGRLYRARSIEDLGSGRVYLVFGDPPATRPVGDGYVRRDAAVVRGAHRAGAELDILGVLLIRVDGADDGVAFDVHLGLDGAPQLAVAAGRPKDGSGADCFGLAPDQGSDVNGAEAFELDLQLAQAFSGAQSGPPGCRPLGCGPCWPR